MKFKSDTEGNFLVLKDYSKKIIFSPKDFKDKNHLIQTVVVPQVKQRPHFHYKQTEIWYVLEGEAHFFLNNIDHLVKTGDTLMGLPGEIHYVWNKNKKEFKLLVFKINVPEGDDTKWLSED